MVVQKRRFHAKSHIDNLAVLTGCAGENRGKICPSGQRTEQTIGR